MSKELFEKESLAIKAAVEKELTARDNLFKGVANLGARKRQLELEMSSNAELRSKMVLRKIEHTKTGASNKELDNQIAQSQEMESVYNEELRNTEEAIPVEEEKLKRAEAALKRAAFAAIENVRPDTEVDALFAAAMDFVETWQAKYDDLLKRELNIQFHGIYDGEWWINYCDPRLTNPTVRRLLRFIPPGEQPEQPEVLPEEQPEQPAAVPVSNEQPVKPRPLTDAEAQADARKDGRNKDIQSNKQQEVMDSGYSILD